MIRKATVGVGLLILLSPLFVSAQAVYLSPEARQQLLVLTTQLVQIAQELAAAQAQGPAYVATDEFRQKTAVWISRVTQIQQGVSAIVASAASPAYPSGPAYAGGACPNLSRDLIPGSVGADVGELQRFLARDPAARYPGEPHNLYDPSTVQALQRFQSAYGIVRGGNWNTTGYGRVGPATRAAIASVCSQRPQVTYPVPIPAPIPTPISTSVPTPGPANATLSASSKGQPERTVAFTVRTSAIDPCPPVSFVLSFGDGQEQVVSFPPSCSVQNQTIIHTYPQLGSYSARLTSGGFQTSVSILVALSNYSLSLKAEQDDVSYSVLLTATYDPGARCENNDYKLTWGDGASQTISFSNNSCNIETKTFKHTYEQSGTYTIRALDNVGHSASLSFQATVLAAAGAGDQSLVLNVHAEGPEGSTSIVDSSLRPHTISAQGGARIDADDSAVGDSALELDGDAYASIEASNDFKYGPDAFTVNLWFKPDSLPVSGNQAALLVQANSNALDSSLGGAGLVLYGDALYFIGRIGTATYHPLYNNTIHTGSLSADTWYHAAVVRFGNTVSLYLNGALQSSLNVSGSANSSDSPLSIGRYGGYNGNYFTGLIDEVQISKGVAKWTSNFTPPTDHVSNVTTNTTSYASGSAITVSWSTSEAPQSKDFIGLAYVNGDWSMTFNGEGSGWAWTDSAASGSKTLVAPAPGSYQVVYYISSTGEVVDGEEAGRSPTFTVY